MMTSKLEQISALADDQWDDQALEALLADPQLQASWSRYHQQKDALQGEDVTLAGADFASRVAAAIADEPTVLAPSTERRVRVPGKVVQLFRQAGQYAIAATVAAVAIVGVQQLSQESVDESPLPVLNTNPVLGVSTAPVSVNFDAPGTQRSAAMMSQNEARERLLEQKRRINAYFQDHELQQRIQQADPLLLESALESTEDSPTAP